MVLKFVCSGGHLENVQKRKGGVKIDEIERKYFLNGPCGFLSHEMALLNLMTHFSKEVETSTEATIRFQPMRYLIDSNRKK